jgi:hypothetical protein
MRALCQNDGSLVKKELEHCLKLDSTLDRIRLILRNVRQIFFELFLLKLA